MKAVKVQTTLAADIDTVWSCWTTPEHIVNWNFATDDWHCPHAENDLTVNGRFKYTMAAKNGSMSFDFEGTYDEIVYPQKLAYHLTDGRQVVVEFEQTGDQTMVTETFDPESVNPVDLQRQGWQFILNNFKKYVESM